MSNHKQSQCQMFRLHIDAYLDNELEPARIDELNGHAAHCQDCREELAYAGRLHRAVAGLPLLDCSDQALEPIDRLFESSGGKPGGDRSSWLESLRGWLLSAPAGIRYGIPALAVLVLLVGLGGNVLIPGNGTDQVVSAPQVAAAPEYSQEDIIQALEDLELAIGYLSEISERTEVMIEERFLLRQLQESINATFDDDDGGNGNQTDTNGPI